MKKIYLLPLLCAGILLQNAAEAQDWKLVSDSPSMIEKMKADGATAEQIEQYLIYMQTPVKKETTPSLLSTTCSDALESGNFNDWTGSTGNTNGTGNPTWTGFSITPGRHTILSTAGNDACADSPGIPITFPAPNFGNNSAQLGNNINGAQAERLSYSFLVDPLNTNFSFTYALVMEDPGHTAADQPFFHILMLDATGDTIPNSYFYYVSGPSLPGFVNSTSCSGSVYKKWTIRGVDLSPYIGQNVTLIATNADCNLSGHFGYSYLDFDCDGYLSPRFCQGSPMTIDASSEPNSQYLWEDNSTAPTFNIASPVAGDTVSCTVTPWAGYSFNLNFILTPEQASFVPAISSNTVTFTNTTWAPSACSWDFGDGNLSTNCNPVHTYLSPGTYTVCLTVQSGSGCSNLQTCSTVIILGTGLNEHSQNENIMITPNPASDKVIIELRDIPDSEKMDISVYNIIGKEIRSTQVSFTNGKCALNVSDLSSGAYFVKLRSSGVEITKKMIVSKE